MIYCLCSFKANQMLKKIKLYAVKVVQYQDRKIFYGVTETGDVPPEIYGHPDTDGDECLIEFFPVLNLKSTDEYAKQRNWQEVEVIGIQDFYIPPLSYDVRWFVSLDPTEITVAPKRKRLLGKDCEIKPKTCLRKNIRLEIELSKQLEGVATQNSLQISEVIEAALRQYLNR